MGSNRKIKYWIVLVVTVFLALYPVRLALAATGTVKVTGTCDYDRAYKVIGLVNKERKKKGEASLKMDEDLMKAAMLRAAECSVAFSHTRPSGKSCFTVCKKSYGENIAYGYYMLETPKEVMKSWMDSSGHRKNILRSNYQSIGVGCFRKNGSYYWVQCFGINKADAGELPQTKKTTYNVSVKTNIKVSRVTKVKLLAGKQKLTLKWKKQKGISGYNIQISTSRKFKKAQTSSYTVSKSATSKSLTVLKGKNLEAGKRYYVRIRAYTKKKQKGKMVTVCGKWVTANKKTK